MKSISLRLLLIGFSVIVFTSTLLSGDDAKAIPSFGRMYGISCSVCHTSPPKLNETGYQFRAGGFRMPSEVGKEGKPFKFTDYTSVRLQGRYDGIRSRRGSERDTLQKANLFAAELYTLYGPWGKYVSSNFKVTVWPDKTEETEGHIRVEGNIRATFGNSKRFIDIRAGVPHPMEGFGASEYYAIGNKRPLFQETAANFNQNTFFTPLNFHQAALTVGYYRGKTSIRAYFLGGLRLHLDEHNQLEPFGSREPFTKHVPESKHKGPDFQLFVNRILHPNGGAISMYYYAGNQSLPIEHEDDETDTGSPEPTRFFQNRFNRLAFYGSYPITKRNVLLLGGIQGGRDRVATGGTFGSLGTYIAGEVPVINELTALGLRYDWFDPSRNKARNSINAVTLYGNVWIKEQFRIVPEYQYKVLGNGLGVNRVDNAFQLRLIFIK